MARGQSEQFKSYQLQLVSRLKLKNVYPGEWESIHVGEGIEYSASKPYEPGDDLRDLDLQALVQSGEEEIIQRAVGRQRQIFIWVDLTGSMQRQPEMVFSDKPAIRDIAVGLLTFSAWHTYSPVGLCAFDRRVRQFFQARSGESYCEELVTWFLEHADQGARGPADIEGALDFLRERISAQSLVLFISDFQDAVFEGHFAPLFRAVAKRYDFVPVVIRDPLECAIDLKHTAVLAICDSEGTRRNEMTITPSRLTEIREASARHLGHVEQQFREVGLEHVVLNSAELEHCYQTLAGFFQSRRRTRG